MTQLSRRKLLKSAGAASVAGAVVLGSNWKANAQTAQDTAEQLPSTKKVLERHEDYQVFLSSGDVVVGFDKRYGTVSSITRKSDPYSLNYISNAKNTPAEKIRARQDAVQSLRTQNKFIYATQDGKLVKPFYSDYIRRSLNFLLFRKKPRFPNVLRGQHINHHTLAVVCTFVSTLFLNAYLSVHELMFLFVS